MSTISSIFSVLNEFKYEEDKRLLGYVLIYELCKKKINSDIQEFYTDEKYTQKNNVGEKKQPVNNEISVGKKPIQNIKKAAETVSNIDFSIFEEKWNDIKLEMKNKEAVVNALMMNNYHDRMENNDVIIMFHKKSPATRD